jgi:glycosyltransferase involved in cell wall biosynthesis
MTIVQVPRRFVRAAWGGPETVVLETGKRLRAMGHDVSVLCPNVLADSNEETISGVPVQRVPYNYPYWFLKPDARAALDRRGGNLFSFALLRRLLARPTLDIIHAHAANRLGGICRYAARRRGIPYVITVHSGDVTALTTMPSAGVSPTRGAIEWGRLLGLWVGARRALTDAAAIICVGAQQQQALQQRFPHKHVVFIPNGVEPRDFADGDGVGFRATYGIPENAWVVLTVGRIDPEKNQLCAVQAMAHLALQHPAAFLLLIGHVSDEAYARQVRAAATAAGLEGRCLIIPGLGSGSRTLRDAYHAANAFLLPSNDEPFGLVALEAWAAGLPVVASRVGGIPALIQDQVDGLLCDADDVEQFATALSLLIEHPQTAARLAHAGLNKARTQYDWGVIAQRLLQLYDDVLAAHRRR